MTTPNYLARLFTHKDLVLKAMQIDSINNGVIENEEQINSEEYFIDLFSRYWLSEDLKQEIGYSIFALAEDNGIDIRDQKDFAKAQEHLEKYFLENTWIKSFEHEGYNVAFVRMPEESETDFNKHMQKIFLALEGLNHNPQLVAKILRRSIIYFGVDLYENSESKEYKKFQQEFKCYGLPLEKVIEAAVKEKYIYSVLGSRSFKVSQILGLPKYLLRYTGESQLSFEVRIEQTITEAEDGLREKLFKKEAQADKKNQLLLAEYGQISYKLEKLPGSLTLIQQKEAIGNKISMREAEIRKKVNKAYKELVNSPGMEL